ncbi:MAG: hypothetical protein WCJ09_09265 [Planctomycetota bacterium]
MDIPDQENASRAETLPDGLPETKIDLTQNAVTEDASTVEPAVSPPLNEGGVDANGDPILDTRLYVPDNEDWDVHIKRDSDRLYCYSKHPGQDWFHLLLNGEIYVSRQHEKYCLRCALRMGFLTEDRLFWQHRVPKKRNRITPL